jgi:hypothetical protein
MLREAFKWAPDSPLARYFESIQKGHVWYLAAVVCALTIALAERSLRLRGGARSAALYVLASIAAAWGVYHAYKLAWLSDDAFISFRYARNWVTGKGLVYNAGERVEGYTNFLWTALIALGIRLGLEAARWSMVLSLASLVGVVGLTTRLLDKLRPGGRPSLVSLAGLALATNYTFASYGTSGLETMGATLLVLLAVERADSGAFVAAGAAAIGATLMHPDHAVFYATLGAAVALIPENRRRNLARYAAPFVFVFVPYYLARWHYYGDFFPNTYYAKSGGDAYFTQGAVYLWVSGLAAGVVAVLPFSIWGTYLNRHHLVARFTMFAVPSYLAYVAKIGGDFMLGRLLCPVLPYVLLMAESAMRRYGSRRRYWFVSVAGIGAMALVAVPNGLVRPWEKYMNIADERVFYRLKSIDPLVVDTGYTGQATSLLQAFKGASRPPLLGVGCIGVVGWLTDYPIMDNWGLVNRSVAHMPIKQRGRPGHEKLATPGHAFEHDIDFSDIRIWPDPYDNWSKVNIAGFDFSFAKFDPSVKEALERNGNANLPDIEGRLRNYSAAASDSARLDCDHWFFEQIYFSARRNDELRTRIVAKWVAARPDLAGVDDLLFGSPAERDPNWRSQTLFSFDDLAGWTVIGDAFADDPTRRDVPGQGRAAGAHGAYVNSLDEEKFDGAVGTLISPPFVIRGDAITLRVGGGMKPTTAMVRLRVDGNVVASSTGCDSDVLGRRVWPVAALRGKRATLEVVDEGHDGWSHVLVDEVVEWTRGTGDAPRP